MHLKPTMEMNSALMRTVDHMRSHVRYLRNEADRLDLLADNMAAMAGNDLVETQTPTLAGLDVEAFAAEIEQPINDDGAGAMAKRFAPALATAGVRA